MILQYCVYILFSEKDKKFYIGFTTNIDRRFKEHNQGKVLSTKSRRPFRLIYCEFHDNKVDAIRRENYFKTSAGKKVIKLILREKLAELAPF